MAEYITEATENLVKNNLAMFCKYRYTFKKDEQNLEVQQDILKRFCQFIRETYAEGNRIIGGIEHYTKGMILTNAHIHIHFVSKHKSDTIRKGMARRFDLIGRCQACKPEVILDSEAKFWRYPLKQQKGDTARGNFVSGFDKEEMRVEAEVAYQCWRQAAEVAVNKVEKKLERTSQDRLFAFLESLGILENEEAYVCAALEYYAENEESFCFKTIEGYAQKYMLLRKVISYKDFYKLQKKKY